MMNEIITDDSVQVKIVDKLNYEDEEKTQAVDSLGHKFDISQLEEAEQNSCKKIGLCPSCLQVLARAVKLKQASITSAY